MIANLPRPIMVEMAARAAGILSSSTKLDILLTLAEGPAEVSTLCGVLRLSQPLVSHHLKALREIGAVKAVRSKRSRLYSLADRATVERTVSSVVVELRVDCTSLRIEFDAPAPPTPTVHKTMARSPSA